MIISDGECPNCGAAHLYLNTDDLLECPSCSLVCANPDGIVATVMPFLGRRSFRFEDCTVGKLSGTAFARSEFGGVKPDTKALFQNREELTSYLDTLPPTEVLCKKNSKLLQTFHTAFRVAINETDASELNAAWSSNTQRTDFYCNALMPNIAMQLDMVHRKEEFKVDYVLSRRSRDGQAIPQIFIESENNYESASHEISKLCSINSPLRVLITVTHKLFTPEPSAGAFKKLREWQAVVRAHQEINHDFRGIISVIVGQQRTNGIHFHACALAQDGSLCWPLSPLVSKSAA